MSQVFEFASALNGPIHLLVAGAMMAMIGCFMAVFASLDSRWLGALRGALLILLGGTVAVRSLLFKMLVDSVRIKTRIGRDPFTNINEQFVNEQHAMVTELFAERWLFIVLAGLTVALGASFLLSRRGQVKPDGWLIMALGVYVFQGVVYVPELHADNTDMQTASFYVLCAVAVLLIVAASIRFAAAKPVAAPAPQLVPSNS